MISKITAKTREKIELFCSSQGFTIIDNSQNHMCFCFSDISRIPLVVTWLEKELCGNLAVTQSDCWGGYIAFKEILGQCDDHEYRIRCSTHCNGAFHQFYTVLISCANS